MSYITGELIKELREKKHLTQKELADKIMVSDKTISKWETNKGLPDIGIIDELAGALGISVADLLTGEYRENENVSANMKKMHFYVCPVCGNVITSIGSGSFSCCGISLMEQETEAEYEENHRIQVETIEHEYHVFMNHEMTKNHYISFIAYVTSDTVELKKLYPEQEISVRFSRKGHGCLYVYCNRHGMMSMRV